MSATAVAPESHAFLSGASCCWNSLVAEAADFNSRCPFCKGNVVKWSSEGAWWNHIDAYERGEYEVDAKAEQPARPHPSYRAMWEWGIAEMRARKSCYRNIVHLKNSYRKHTGTDVDIAR
jgi:hypothetical protein